MRIFWLILVTFLLSVVFYISLDKQLYYYGTSTFHFYNLLPINISVVDRADFEGGFAILDDVGLCIAGKGNTYKYNNGTIEINEILSYGYNQSKVIAKFKDPTEKVYFIEFKKNDDKNSKKILAVKFFEFNDNLILDEYNWINIKGKNSKVREILISRSVLFLFIVGLGGLLLILIIKSLIKTNYGR
jgi:hypothetical protein